MAAKTQNPNETGTAAFPVLHPSSVPLAQRGNLKQRAKQDTADRRNTRKILKGHAVVQANAVMDTFSSHGLPTAKELAARNDAKKSTQPPALAEYQARKYGTKAK